MLAVSFRSNCEMSMYLSLVTSFMQAYSMVLFVCYKYRDIRSGFVIFQLLSTCSIPFNKVKSSSFVQFGHTSLLDQDLVIDYSSCEKRRGKCFYPCRTDLHLSGQRTVRHGHPATTTTTAATTSAAAAILHPNPTEGHQSGSRSWSTPPCSQPQVRRMCTGGLCLNLGGAAYVCECFAGYRAIAGGKMCKRENHTPENNPRKFSANCLLCNSSSWTIMRAWLFIGWNFHYILQASYKVDSISECNIGHA